MSEEQTETLSLKAAYTFGIAHQLEREVTDIRDMEIEWDPSYPSSLRRGYIVTRFEKHRIFEEFEANHWGLWKHIDRGDAASSVLTHQVTVRGVSFWPRSRTGAGRCG